MNQLINIIFGLDIEGRQYCVKIIILILTNI
jgi:hypothetical protein